MRNEALGRLIPSRDDLAVIGFVILLYVEILIFGANRGDLALFFAVTHLVLLLVVLATKTGRRVLTGAPLAWPALCFLSMLLGALFSIVPLGGRIGHPLWTYVAPGGGAISLDPVATRLEIVKLVGLAAVFLLALVLAARRERAETFVRWLSYAGGAYAVWALLSWMANPHMIFGVVRPYGGERLSGSFLSANSAGTLFACQTMLQLCLALRIVRKAPAPLFSRRALAAMKGLPMVLVLLLPSACCLLLTASRGAAAASLASLTLALTCFAFVRSDRRSAIGGVAVVAGLVLFAGFALFVVSGNALSARLGPADNPLADNRLAIFAGYWRSVAASPWWGYGLGAFRAFNFQSITADNAVAMGNLGAAHNVYLQWLLQSGVVGFLPMMACVALILAGIAAGFNRRSSQQMILIFALAASAVFAVHGAVDYGLEEPALAALFAAILGLGYAVSIRA